MDPYKMFKCNGLDHGWTNYSTQCPRCGSMPPRVFVSALDPQCVTGKYTYELRDLLKEMGGFWKPKKKMWWFASEIDARDAVIVCLATWKKDVDHEKVRVQQLPQ